MKFWRSSSTDDRCFTMAGLRRDISNTVDMAPSPVACELPASNTDAVNAEKSPYQVLMAQNL